MGSQSDVCVPPQPKNTTSLGGLTRRGQQMDSRAMAACLSGDVLAGLPQDQLAGSPNKDKKIQLRLWPAS